MLAPTEVAHAVPAVTNGAVRSNLANRPDLEWHTGASLALTITKATRPPATIHARPLEHLGGSQAFDIKINSGLCHVGG